MIPILWYKIDDATKEKMHSELAVMRAARDAEVQAEQDAEAAVSTESAE